MCFNDTFCFSVGNFLIWRLYYEPIKVYVPRRFYRDTRVAPQDDHWAYEEPSIKSTPYAFDINYNIEYYTGHEDTYVIGGYPFAY